MTFVYIPNGLWCITELVPLHIERYPLFELQASLGF